MEYTLSLSDLDGAVCNFNQRTGAIFFLLQFGLYGVEQVNEHVTVRKVEITVTETETGFMRVFTMLVDTNRRRIGIHHFGRLTVINRFATTTQLVTLYVAYPVVENTQRGFNGIYVRFVFLNPAFD